MDTFGRGWARHRARSSSCLATMATQSARRGGLSMRQARLLLQLLSPVVPLLSYPSPPPSLPTLFQARVQHGEEDCRRSAARPRCPWLGGGGGQLAEEGPHLPLPGAAVTTSAPWHAVQCSQPPLLSCALRELLLCCRLRLSGGESQPHCKACPSLSIPHHAWARLRLVTGRLCMPCNWQANGHSATAGRGSTWIRDAGHCVASTVVQVCPRGVPGVAMSAECGSARLLCIYRRSLRSTCCCFGSSAF